MNEVEQITNKSCNYLIYTFKNCGELNEYVMCRTIRDEILYIADKNIVNKDDVNVVDITSILRQYSNTKNNNNNDSIHGSSDPSKNDNSNICRSNNGNRMNITNKWMRSNCKYKNDNCKSHGSIQWR